MGEWVVGWEARWMNENWWVDRWVGRWTAFNTFSLSTSLLLHVCHVEIQNLLLDPRHVALLSSGPKKKLADLGP